jgi:cell division protein FtsZ
MVFITAGMGGGTGTGAACNRTISQRRDILTVGIVTLPFLFEGKCVRTSVNGIEKLRKQVDSLVINNNKLRSIRESWFQSRIFKTDEVLATASRGIAKITHHYTQNIDLRDAKTVLYNSGTAIMGSSVSSGENRAKEAIVAALDSPVVK